MTYSQLLAELRRFIWREQYLGDALNAFFDRPSAANTAKLAELRKSLSTNNYSSVLEKLEAKKKTELAKPARIQSPKFRRYV